MRSYSAEATYTLQDLDDWDFPGPSLAVLGHPVRHSISPQMHNAALAALAQQRPELAQWKYFRFDVPPEQLLDALPIFHRKGFLGLNLTVPHKEIAAQALDRIDEDAQAIGAVNTLLRQESGYVGYNSDGYGLAAGIAHDLNRSLKGAEVALLGAGGAARAAAILCLRENCQRLTIVNRNQDRLARLLQALEPLAAARNVTVRGLAPHQADALPANALLINATSLGLKTDDPLPIAEERVPAAADCYDMIYNPPLTKLMAVVRQKGGRAANGLSMLVRQGAKSLGIWTGLPAPHAIMQDAALAALETHRP